jgi:hypothetical protein
LLDEYVVDCSLPFDGDLDNLCFSELNILAFLPREEFVRRLCRFPAAGESEASKLGASMVQVAMIAGFVCEVSLKKVRLGEAPDDSEVWNCLVNEGKVKSVDPISYTSS